MAYLAPSVESISPRRTTGSPDWVSPRGLAALRRGAFGPSRQEREARGYLAAVRRDFGGLRQVTVANPAPGAGKTVATFMLALTFAQTRGGSILAWDDDEHHARLAQLAQTYPPTRTAMDLVRHVRATGGPAVRADELRTFVTHLNAVPFDLLAAGPGRLTAREFRQVREIVSHAYRLLVVDTGDDPQAEGWQAAMDSTDQLVLAISAHDGTADTAERLLDQLEQTGRTELARRTVTVVSAARRADARSREIARHFERRCRAALTVPYDRLLSTYDPVSPEQLAGATRRAWLRVAATVADGL